MKNRTKFWGIIVIGTVIVSALSLAGCATSVPIKSVRPPTINTSDMQRLAIKPFENKSGVTDPVLSPVAAQITQYLTDRSNQIIMSSGNFTNVAPTDPNADGVFSGELRSIRVNQSQTPREMRDKEGNPYIETAYTREVTLEFVYSVISSRTGTEVGTVTKRGSQNDSQTDPSRVADTLTLAKRIVDSQLRELQQDIVPTIVNTNRQLMNETSKDKAVKQGMKEAQTLVKNGNYLEAIRLYDVIGTSAAKTNAGILREAIASDTAAQARLAELSAAGGLVENSVKRAIDLLNSRMPSGTNIIILKTSSTDRVRLDDIVDRMTKTIVQEKRLVVVDRANQDLINAEQQFQLSGNVSDDSIISIGHQLGARYMVLCWISGQMSSRRLNIRVLDVETSAVTDQSEFEI